MMSVQMLRLVHGLQLVDPETGLYHPYVTAERKAKAEFGEFPTEATMVGLGFQMIEDARVGAVPLFVLETKFSAAEVLDVEVPAGRDGELIVVDFSKMSIKELEEYHNSNFTAESALNIEVVQTYRDAKVAPFIPRRVLVPPQKISS